MQLFHGQQRDERRRRVLSEDRDAEPTKTASPPCARKAEAYSDGARPENHRRISDFVPISYLHIGLLFLAGMTAIAGLAAGYLYLPELTAWTAKEGSAAFDLGGRGSLGAWLSSLWLGLAGLTSLLIYSIRRHKLDDYRGHYRWWLVAAAAWLVMSIDATAGVHDLFRAAMMRLSDNPAPLAGNIWWIGCWGLLLATTMVRLLLDMRACRIALATIVLAVASWCAGLTIQLAAAQLTNIPAALVAETLKLFGHLLLLTGVTLYARHVILHAQGLLSTREQKPRKVRAKKEAKPAAASNGAQVARIDPAHPATNGGDKRIHAADATKPAVTPHSHLAAASSAADRDDDLSDDDESNDRNRKLTKADRKRLRKQKSEERGW